MTNYLNSDSQKRESPEINNNALELAREYRGFTQSELSAKLGLSQGQVSKIIMGIQSFPNEYVDRLSQILNFPSNFFYTNVKYYKGISLHRKKLRISQKELNRIDAYVNIINFHLLRLLSSVDFEVNIPNYSNDILKTPGEIAQQLRIYWKVPDGPIENLTKLLEDNGIFVIAVDFKSDLIDGLSVQFPETPPLIFINKNYPGDRIRFTIAHELGHILLHDYPTEESEREANEFAAELLMPKKLIAPHLKNLNIEKLVQLKKYFKVSMASILKRAKDLEIIDDYFYRRMWQKFSRRGYKKTEPINILIEQPNLIEELVTYHVEKLGYSLDDFMKLLLLHQREVIELYLHNIKKSEYRVRLL